MSKHWQTNYKCKLMSNQVPKLSKYTSCQRKNNAENMERKYNNAGEEPSYKQAGLSNSSSYSGQQAFQIKNIIRNLKWFYGERKREPKKGLQFWQAVQSSEKANKYNSLTVQRGRYIEQKLQA